MKSRYSIPQVIYKNIHIIPKNLMKTGSFEFKKNKNCENKINLFNINPKKKRANSNDRTYCDFNQFENKFDDLEIIDYNVSYRNKSSIGNILTLKSTEKDDIEKVFNNFKTIKIQKKNSDKKNVSMENIFNNYNKVNSKSRFSKSKLKKKDSKNSIINLLKKTHILEQNSNKLNKISMKNLKLNTFNNENKYNDKNINNQSFSRFTDAIMKKNNISNTMNVETKNRDSFIYIKKNNLGYSKLHHNKSKNKSFINSTAFSTTFDNNQKNKIQNSINNIDISEFKLEEEQENEQNNSLTDIIDENDDTEEANINKINKSYICKYKNIEQIEKKIENENIINRIINMNIKKKPLNNNDNLTNILSTATFGQLETQKKD